jgi:acetyltransferase-like isoleucine patch superfamily enzyme
MQQAVHAIPALFGNPHQGRTPMIHFRIRDMASALFYRMMAPAFGQLGRGARIVRPLRLVGVRHLFLGSNATIQVGSYFAALPDTGHVPEVHIGNGSMIGNHAHIICTRRIAIGANVLIADRLYIADNAHDHRDPARPVIAQGLRQLADVSIGDGAWIGENVCIIGASVGRNSVIGANSVVTRSIADHTVAVGAPAVAIKRYCFDRKEWLPTNPSGEFLP